MGDIEPFSLGGVYTMLHLCQEQIRLSIHSYVKYFLLELQHAIVMSSFLQLQ